MATPERTVSTVEVQDSQGGHARDGRSPEERRAGSCAIEVEHLSHSFRGHADAQAVHVLEDVSISVGSGEVLGLIGPSGCGKTTVLNCVAGLLKPMAGTVQLEGHAVSGIQAPAVAYMLARDALLPWRTALENVKLSLEVAHRHKDKDADEQSRRAMRLVGLAGFENHYPSQLSSGMRQRVALARTLVVDARVWIMDEPFSALDAFTRASIHKLFSSIREAEGTSVLLVTHDLAEAIVLSDRIAVMATRPGQIKDVYTVPFARPRELVDLRATSEFAQLYAQLWNDLKGEIDFENVLQDDA